MNYRQLIKKVQDYSGFSDKESEDALQVVVETLATRLTPEERKDFSSQLPAELQKVAEAVTTTRKLSADDFFKDIIEAENIDEGRAKKQIMAVWQALKDAISPGEIEDIKAQLPKDLAAQLH